MKTEVLNYKRIITILTFAFLFSTGHAWAKVDRTKEYTYNFKCKEDVRIDLKAYSSEVKIESWNKNEVFIKATIKVEAKTQEKIDAFLAKANLEPKSSDNYISIENPFNIRNVRTTQIINARTKVTFNDGEKLSIGNYSISYQIFMPVAGYLNLKNSYGDVEITNLISLCNIEIYSGDLKANNLGELNLTLKYGNAEINSSKDAKIELFESKMQLMKADNINLNTRYSRVDLGETNLLYLTSYEDRIKIGKLNKLDANIKYGNLFIAKVDKLEIRSAYETNAEITEANSTHMVSSKYGNYEIGRIKELVLDQSYEDDMVIMEIQDLSSANCKYAKFKVHNLTNSLVVNGYEADVTLLDVAKDFTKLDVNGKYMDLQFTLAQGAQYGVSADVKYPSFVYSVDNFEITKSIKQGPRIQLEMQKKGATTKKNLSRVAISGYEIDMVLKEL